LATQRPVLVFFEDLHWIDPSTEEVLKLLIERLGQSRILLLCTYRLDYQAPWIGRAGVTQLALSPFDRKRSLAMVSQLMAEEELPGDLLEQIVDRSEGVPLFIEELTRTLLERQRLVDGSFVTGVSLPSSLKELLMAKLDSLSSARDIVPLCAAIGRSFSYRLLLAISGLSKPELMPIIEQLVHSQILLYQGEYPNVTLTFRHALIQEAAYETMLQSRARSLHARIADVLETQFPALAAERPEVIAQHLSRARRATEARDKWREAARLAIARSANVEATADLEHALEENAKLEEGTDRVAAEIELREMMREPLELCGWGSDKIERNLRRLYELRESESDLEGMFSVLRGSCLTHGLAGNVRQALEAVERLREVAEKSADPVHEIVALHHRAMCAFLGGDFDNAIAHFEREITTLTPELQAGIRRYYPADFAVVARLMQAWAMILSDRQGEADRRIAEARALSEGHEQPFTRTYGLALLAALHQTRGEPRQSLADATAAHDLACENRMAYWEAWASILRGWGLVAAEGDREGVEVIREGLRRYTRTGARQLLPYGRTLLADALHRTGQHALALKELDDLAAEEHEVCYFGRRTAELAAELRRKTGSTDDR
ncbi:MAG: ATP-binding protein, partial [bacterium]